MLQHLLEEVVLLAKSDGWTQFSWIQSPENISEYHHRSRRGSTVRTVDTLRAAKQKLKFSKLTDKN
jgi:hypothetical protein